MTKAELMALSDDLLALLYTTWSEDLWCAAWYMATPTELTQGFLPWLQTFPPRPLEDYELVTVVELRRLITALPEVS